MLFKRSAAFSKSKGAIAGHNPLGSSLPPVAMRVSHQVTLGNNTPLMLLVLLVGMAGISIIVYIATRIGLQQDMVRMALLSIPLIILTFATIRYSTTRLAQFTNVEGAARAGENGMAMGAELAGLIGVIGFATLFLQSNHEAFATIAGVVTGLMILGLCIVGGLANSSRALGIGAVNILAQTELSAKRGSRLIIALYGLIGFISAMALAVGALKTLTILFEFAFDSQQLMLGLLIVVVVMAISGGQRSLSVSNMFFYCLAAGFLAVPAIWLSIRIAGNPFAPLSFGNFALEPIMQLTQQLQIESAETSNLFGNFARFSNPLNFAFVVMLVAVGIACLPFLHRRVNCNNAVAGKIKTAGIGMFSLICLFALIPTIIAFTQFEIYRDVVGLTPQQLSQSAPWLFDWASKTDGSQILVCSQVPESLQTIAKACGEPDYQILPTDLEYSAWMVMIGSGAISDMPLVISNMMAIAVLGLGFAIFGASLSGAANSLVGNVFFSSSADKRVTKNPSVASVGQMKRLFLTRSALLACALMAYYSHQSIEVIDAIQLLYWTLAITGGTLFCALMAAIWWPNIEPYGVLAAQIVGLLIVGFLAFESWQNGFLKTGFLPQPGQVQPAAIAAGLGIVGSAIAGATAHSVVKFLRTKRRNKPTEKSN